LAVVGVLWFVGLPASRAWAPAPEAGSHGVLGALRSPGIRTLVITTLPMGFCFGTMEVALPAFADDEGRRAFAGVLLAVWSLASAAGGLWYGALTLRGTPGGRYARLALLLPLGYLPLSAATSPELMVLLVIPAGLCIAPLIIAGNQLVGDVAPAGALTEAYTWPITSLVGGVAAGNAAAGLLVEAVNWRAALLAAVAGAALGALLTARRRLTLLPGSG
jgi:MFS family permease